MRIGMRSAGFTVIEMLLALTLVSVFYAFFSVNFDVRSRAVNFAASMAQARVWADAAEIDRQSGVLPPGVTAAPVATPFDGPYRITATEHAAIVSFELPFTVRGGGVFVVRDGGSGGTLHATPSVFAPTLPMQEKMGLYKEAVR